MKVLAKPDSLSQNALNDLLRDAAIVRLVTIVNLSSLSILEILEYGVTPHDVSEGLAEGIIQFDKPSSIKRLDTEVSALEVGGDYYFRYLNNKVKLTDLGVYILETIARDPTPLLSTDDPSFSKSIVDRLTVFDGITHFKD